MNFCSGKKRTVKYLSAAATLAVALLLTAFSGAVFAAEDEWALRDIYMLEAKGVYDPGIGDPYAVNMTRGEFAAMIVRGLGLGKEAGLLQGYDSGFSDVPPDYEYAGEIRIAYEYGLAAGYPGGEFRPGEELRRDQAVVFLMRLIEGEKTEYSSDFFTDGAGIPLYARESVVSAVSMKLVAGFPDGSFRPADRMTAAEAAAFVFRFLSVRNDIYDFSGFFSGLSSEGEVLVRGVNGTVAFPADSWQGWFSDGVFSGGTYPAEGSAVGIVLRDGNAVAADYLPAGFDDAYSFAVSGSRRETSFPEEGTESSLFSNYYSLYDSEGSINGSLQTNKAEMNLPSLVSRMGTDGSGIVIAVVDSGIDVSHPDLMLTSEGGKKVTGWYDYTEEGIVYLDKETISGNGFLVEGEKYLLGGEVVPGSSIVYTSYVEPYRILPPGAVGAGAPRPSALAVLADGEGAFTKVFIDFDGDGVFSPDEEEREYNSGGKAFSFGFYEDKTYYVVSEIKISGTESLIRLSADTIGHGTHVAGILAANGKLQGLAPGAELLSMKVADSNWYINPENILEAVREAGEIGADIVNISAGQSATASDGYSGISGRLAELAEEFDMLIVAAAGNDGKGLSSVSKPADSPAVIGVGAYLSPRMSQVLYGEAAKYPEPLSDSSSGPCLDGGICPAVTAPGSAVSTLPSWKGGGYGISSGTSMAAPHVTGSLAHIVEAARNSGVAYDYKVLTEAVKAGARSSAGISVFRGGYGIFDVFASWQELVAGTAGDGPAVRIETDNFIYGSGTGIFAREYLPVETYMDIISEEDRPVEVEFSCDAGWVTLVPEKVLVPPGETRRVDVSLSPENKRGLWNCLIKGSAGGRELLVPVTVCIPEKINPGEDADYLAFLAAGNERRYYLRVPAGMESLTVEMEMFPDTAGEYSGRALFSVYGPMGEEVFTSSHIGEGAYALSDRPNDRTTVYYPEAGTWEIIADAESDVSGTRVKYRMYLALDGKSALSGVSRIPVFSMVPAAADAGVKNVAVYDVSGNPYEGWLQTGGYDRRFDGRVALPAGTALVEIVEAGR